MSEPLWSSIEGVSLLDDFAGQALQGWLSGPCQGDVLDDYADEPKAWREHCAQVARACYDYAEAMVAEKRRREKA